MPRTYHAIILCAGGWFVDQGGLFVSDSDAKQALAETRRRYGVADTITVRATDEDEAARLAQAECDTRNGVNR